MSNLNLETSASMELLGMSRVGEDVPLRNPHDGLDLLHEGGEVEPGLGVDGGELDNVVVLLNVGASHSICRQRYKTFFFVNCK